MASSSVRPLGITVLIASRGDSPESLDRLLNDLDRQDYPSDAVQCLWLDAGNPDETRDLADSRGVTRVEVSVTGAFRSAILNEGLKAADNSLVFTTIGHATLSNNCTLRAAAQHGRNPRTRGAYGVALPDTSASFSERWGARLLGAGRQLGLGAVPQTEGMGLLAADCAVVKKPAIAEVGGYPEEFGAGGGDGQVGQKLAAVEHLQVLRDPVLSVHHTHGFGPLNAWRQLRAWQRMAYPRPFDPGEWRWHPHSGL